jgi:hypothetical protein
MNQHLSIVGLSNEFTPDSAGWVRLAPWGDHPKTRVVQDGAGPRLERWVQRLEREDGERLAHQVNGLWGKVRRAFASVPVYARHPDLGAMSPETGAERQEEVPVGGVSRMEAREDGLYAQIGLFPAGRTAVENEGLKWLSPFWWVAPMVPPTGATPGTLWGRPVGIISVGLTDNPNLEGGQALANQRPPQGVTPQPGTGAGSAPTRISEATPTMKPLLIGLLVANGVAIANDASDDAVLKNINELLARQRTDLTALGNEKGTLSGRVTQLEADLNAEKTAHSQAKTALETARTSLANATELAAVAHVDLAIREGRVAVADRESRIARLKAAADLKADTQALANEQVRYPVGSQGSSASGDRRADANPASADEAQRQLLALANEEIKAGRAADFHQAWLNTKSSHPKLHESLAKKD